MFHIADSDLLSAAAERLRTMRQSSTRTRRAKALPRALVALEILHPTQAVVGMRSVERKRRNIEKRLGRRGKIASFLAERPIPTVLGPGSRLYMIDHHHLGLALARADVEEAYVEIIDDLTDLTRAAFWRRMEAQGKLYPFDEKGRRIPPSQLPSGLPELRHDPYRDLAWYVREAGGFAKSPQPYAEFRWADYYRERISARALRSDFDAAVTRAVKLARCKTAAGLPGFIGA